MNRRIDRPASEPIHDVRSLHDVRIPVRDGLELSANLWLPIPQDDTPDARFPAVLEMIPYRKDDWRYATDVARGEYLAARGYAFCRLDVRGTGSSPGIAEDEYTEAETQDGYDAVEWLAAQPWSNGAVGMWGISWGGFAAIQVAKLGPPHLRAIVPMYATDDRYLDDVHYVGGCLTASEYSQYAVAMVGSNALPPRPAYRGPGWRDEWRDRLERTPIWLFEWRRQQTDGLYWRRGSLAPDWSVVTTPMLMIAGWTDGYVGLLRMMERCVNAPRRIIIGNWSHTYPSDGYPGPRIDWQHEMVRFFDHWLKGIENGAEQEPAMTWFHGEWAPPDPFADAWPGEWRAAEGFPAPGTTTRQWFVAGGDEPRVGRLADAPDLASGADDLAHRATAGARGGALSWRAGHPPNGIAGDLRAEEANGPVYLSPPLEQPLDMLGFGEVVLLWESPVPVATAVVRLSDQAADGIPIQVAIGALNLTHRRSHADPEPLVPGTVTEVRIPLRPAGHRFLAGHRLRLSVATACWPALWPSPEPAIHRLHRGGPYAARLALPIVSAEAAVAAPAFRPPPPPVSPIGIDREEPSSWEVLDDQPAGTVTVRTHEAGQTTLPDGTVIFAAESLAMTASDADPATARMWNACEYRLRQDGVDVFVETEGDLRSTATDLTWDISLRISLDDEPFFERAWSETIPRRLV